MTSVGGVSGRGTSETDWRSLALLLAGNVLFGAGLFVHAFLFNFYLRELNLPPSVMGHQVAAVTIGGLAALLPAGLGIDRLGLRPTLLAGVTLAAAGLVLTAIAAEPAVIYPSALLIGFGGAICRVAWGPAIVRLTDGALRSRAFTWNVALLIASGSVWVYLAGALPEWSDGTPLAASLPLGGTQLALLGSAAVTALAALCYGALPLPVVSAARSKLPSVSIPRDLALLVLLVALWMLAAALVLPFFNIFFAERFAMPVRDVGATFAIVKVATALVLVGAAELAARFGPRRMLAFWTVLMAPALIWLSVTDALWIAIALYFLYGVVAPATNPLIDQLLLERAPRERHGIVAAWRNGAAEGAGAVGASSGGRLLDMGSFASLFLLAGTVAAVAAALLNAGLRRRRMAAEPALAERT